jgi:hypothetical protein
MCVEHIYIFLPFCSNSLVGNTGGVWRGGGDVTVARMYVVLFQNNRGGGLKPL